MEFKLINFLPENWLNALGTMLFHSLWLGVVLAAFSGAVMFATRKTSAKFRYNLLTGCLLLFVFTVSLVFYLALTEKPDSLATPLAGEVKLNLIKLQNVQSSTSDLQFIISSGINKTLGIWNDYQNQIVLIWFLIICAKSVQLLLGVKRIYYLRNNQVYAAGTIWDERLELLSDKLGLSQRIKLLQSGLAKVPMVLGHFKPLILIPLGLLNGLATTEVEAILAHELAHIKRRDYLINLLQCFIEIIFFFNPAVLWVSHLIKTEREHCCDDLAIQCVNDRKNYVKALVFCQEFEQRAPAYAMGITGKTGSLLHRASRMLFNTNSTLNKMEKTILTIALVGTVMCTVAIKSVSNAATVSSKKIASSVFQDTTRKTKSAEQIEKEIDQKMKAAEQSSQSGKKADLGQKALKQDRITAKHIERNAKQSADDARYAAEEKEYAESEKKYKAAEKKYAADGAKYAQAEKKWAEEERARAQEDKKGNKTPKVPKPPRPAGAVVPLTPPTPPAPGIRAVPPTPATPPTPPKVHGSISVNEGNTVHVNVENGKDNTDKISAELLKDGLIANTTNLSFSLDKTNLVVNGVKQNKSLHSKYKAKYLESDNHSLSYVVNVTKSTKK
ncbi:M56 family metallopeptidase [Pedobacter agri]|uniref:M56 family metallopeptidase n=1 Tax=Pedobacter agri TaxID=454586 RepID=UPI00292FC574|nr:M56 family metallopeptidase [Pedobacter agri]